MSKIKKRIKECLDYILNHQWKTSLSILTFLLIVLKVFFSKLIPSVVIDSAIIILVLLVFTRGVWNQFFAVSLFITVLFFSAPFWLGTPLNFQFISDLLSSLRSSDYKSTYGEAIGSLLGSFLAIVAALWTQNYFTNDEEKQAAIKDMRVVYYDLTFATNETYNILKNVAATCNNSVPLQPETYQEIITSQMIFKGRFDKDLEAISTFIHDIHAYNILIVDDWIKLVSSLPDTFTKNERESLYYMYGQINHINKSINAYTTAHEDQKYDYLYAVYQRMYNLLMISHGLAGDILMNSANSVDLERAHYNSVIERLKNNLRK